MTKQRPSPDTEEWRFQPAEGPAPASHRFYEDLCALENIQQAYVHLKENSQKLGVDPLALETIEAEGIEAFLRQLSSDLKAQTYQPALFDPANDAENGEAAALRDLVVKVALKHLLEAAFPPAFPSDPESENAIKRLARHIDKGVCRVYAMNMDETLDAGGYERLVERVSRRIGDPQMIGLLKEMATARSGDRAATEARSGDHASTWGLLTPLLADVAFEGIDQILQQAMTFGREENFFHIQCMRAGNELVVLSDSDPRYEWILPAVKKRLREELACLHYDLAALETQSLDVTGGEALRFLDYELYCVKGRRGVLQVQYRRAVTKPRRRKPKKAASPRRPLSFVQPCLNWIGRRRSWQLLREGYRKANAFQASWRHLPITLFPVVAFLFGLLSPVTWLSLALVLGCNWRWTLSFLRSAGPWAGRHKLDLVMGACAIAALISLAPFVSNIYANRPREVVAYSLEPLPPGFYLGEYHGDSWWYSEPTPAVSYGLYTPPRLQGRPGPFPLIVFLHGYGQRTKTQIFSAGLPTAIASRFGANNPNGDFDFIAFFPIDPTGRWQAGSAEVENAMKALDYVIGRHHIDPSRIYLTGLSAGGNGVWRLAEAYPNKWAAVAPVCSSISPDVAKVQRLPAWIFHGAKDEQAPVERERILVRQLQEAGADVRYTEIPDKGHGIWDDAYNPKELYEWLASKKKD